MLLIKNFEILGCSPLEFEILGISSEIRSISKTQYLDSKAGTKKIIVSRDCFCFYQMFWIVTKRQNAGSKCLKHSRQLMMILLKVVNGGDRNETLIFVHISYLHNISSTKLEIPY